MDHGYARVYKTRAQDRAQKKARAKAPPLVFSTSDSEESDFLPTHLQNRSRHTSAAKQSTPVRVHTPRVQTPKTPSAHGQHQSTEIEIEFESCVSCKKPFGYEEVMVCNYCSDNFCCSCANVPPIVATVQFQVPNLRWYCLPCDKHQSTIIKNFKEGIVAYQTTVPITSTPQPRIVRSKPPQNETCAQSDEIVRMLSDFANRMDNHELLIGELKNVVLNKNQEGSRIETIPAKPTKVNPQAKNQQNQPQTTKNSKIVNFAQVVQEQAKVNQQKQIRPKPPQQTPTASTTTQRPASRVTPAPSAVNTDQQTREPHLVPQRRRLVLTPVAANTEIEEMERRKNNIVIHNLPEQVADNKQQADLEEVNFMLADAMFLTDVKAVTARRLGAPRGDGKPRSLLVNLNSERIQVLKKAGSIRQYELWENVYIDPDRTPKERQEHASMRKELQIRKRNGETDLVIRNGIIVHRRAVPIEIPIEDLAVAPTSNVRTPNPVQLTDQGDVQDSNTQEGQEEDLVPNEAQVSQTQPNEVEPSQGTQSVSDNTLGELEEPEIMRHEVEEEESLQNSSCSIN